MSDQLQRHYIVENYGEEFWYAVKYAIPGLTDQTKIQLKEPQPTLLPTAISDEPAAYYAADSQTLDPKVFEIQTIWYMKQQIRCTYFKDTDILLVIMDSENNLPL